MNGTFDKCCIIRPSGVVKTYFTVEDSKSISFEIDEYDYKYLFDLIEQYSDEYNIIIDSRMSFLILISYFRFGDALIVYDVMRLKMSRILQTMSDYNSTIFYSIYGKRILMLKLFIDWYFKSHSMNWSSDKALQIVTKEKTLTDSLIDYIGVRQMMGDRLRIASCINRFLELMNSNFISSPDQFKEFSIDYIYSALIAMRENGNGLIVW